jgi:hypothetical protein
VNAEKIAVGSEPSEEINRVHHTSVLWGIFYGDLGAGLSKRSPVARQVDHLQAIAGAHAPQNSVDVILYGLFGQV